MMVRLYGLTVLFCLLLVSQQPRQSKIQSDCSRIFNVQRGSRVELVSSEDTRVQLKKISYLLGLKKSRRISLSDLCVLVA